jgi:rhodanese-related sulfurtransferase
MAAAQALLRPAQAQRPITALKLHLPRLICDFTNIKDDVSMFGLFKTRTLTPMQLHDGLKDGRIVLIDVREPSEHAAERIAGAMLFPLSSFDPRRLPEPGDRMMVFQCASGARSATAVMKCRAAGSRFDTHLAGGIAAWKRAGLPTVTRGSAA